ncbi:pyridoxamine 5'-phosphate oxidase family protein [Haliea sp. E17]
MEIPPFFAELLRSPGVATLSMLSSDGSIQSTLVWPDYDGEFIRINTLAGSPKEKNIRREGRATILLYDPQDSDVYITLRCELDRITRDSAIDHLDMLTRRNMNVDKWYGVVEPENAELEARRVVIYLRPVRLYHT